MNIYTIAPIIACIAYIPLILTIAGSRPWQKRYTLFIFFITAAMIWSTVDIFLRSDYFPQHKYLLFQLIIITYMLMAVGLHHFTSSYFGAGYKRWLPFAYGSFLVIVVLTALKIVPESVDNTNGITLLNYGKGVAFVLVPLLVLVGRNYYVFVKMLRHSNNPVLNNQIVTLMLAIGVLMVFTLASFLPFGESFPIAHYGNLINAFILSYAVIRHRLVDIKLVLRRGTAWFVLVIIGLATFWVALIVIHSIAKFQLDLTASLVAAVLASLVALMVYQLKGQLFRLMNRAFQGSSYDYHQRLNDFTNKIHNVFSLKEQGGELLILLIKALKIRQASLLFLESGNGDYRVQFYEPKDESNSVANFRIRPNNPIVKYLEKEQKPLTRENLDILPAFLSLWPQEREDIEARNISMFIPLISRDRLISILVLGEKVSGRYSLEDINIIENATGRVAVSMEKEYLREQLREREEELSVINNSSAILSSSLDIQQIFGTFIEELKKVLEVHWASIILIEDEHLRCRALTSPENSIYQVGEKLPMEGTGSGWVVTQKKTFIEPDLSQERYFTSSEHFYSLGIHTVAYLPLIAKGRVIGAFIVAAKSPNAYSPQQIKLLEQLASQIAMPLENSLLYARAEKKARVDELTGLYNRRSLDEMIDSEISRHSRYGGAFSLAILDLDSFKTYNDTYGHLAGDMLLQEIGRAIKSAIRTADYAFRYGGDEFAVVLPQTTIDAALQVVERVRQKIADSKHSDKIPITASIGLASWPDDGISHTDIIASADVTLYRAKRNGGNQTLCASGAPLDIGESDNKPIDTEKNLYSKFSAIIRGFSEMVDAKSYYTHNHSKKVSEYSIALAKQMRMTPNQIKIIENCGLLHDAGKVSIDNRLLNKPGKLNQEEWEIMKAHPRLGAEIVENIPQLSHCVQAILHHHEWWDGRGYPDGLKGDEIPLEARILAITDAFTTMTSERSYSGTLTYEAAIEEIRKCAGTQFDPVLVEQFAAIFEKQIMRNTEKNTRKK